MPLGWGVGRSTVALHCQAPDLGDSARSRTSLRPVANSHSHLGYLPEAPPLCPVQQPALALHGLLKCGRGLWLEQRHGIVATAANVQRAAPLGCQAPCLCPEGG